MSNFETFDHIFDATIGLDLKGNIVYFNNQALIFFKLSLRQFKQRNRLNELFTAKEIDLNQWISESLLTFSLKVSEETHIRFLHDETECTVILKLIPIETEHGNRYALIFQDKTLEHTLHTKYKEQVDLLKDTHQQIINADKLSTLGQLTASISHEINNPLTIACGHSELLNDFINSPDPMEHLDLLKSTAKNISESLERMNKIVINMKSFLNDQEEAKTYCNTQTIIENASRWVKAQYPSSEIEVKINSHPNHLILANPLKAEQAILNLVKNACEALMDSQTASPRIVIQTTIKQNHVIVSVADNGPGISEQLRSELFKPFSTNKRAGKGTGLGLSICSKIMNSHKGSIKLLDSQKGAHFILAFPTTEHYSLLQSGTDNQAKKVLIIDNDAEILNHFDQILKDTQVNIIGSGDISLATKALNQMNIDLVLLNPHFSSDSLEAIKASKAPLIFLTSEELKSQIPFEGELLLKPYSAKDVNNIIAKVL